MTDLYWYPCFFSRNLTNSCHTMKRQVGSRTTIRGFKGFTFHVSKDAAGNPFRSAWFGTYNGATIDAIQLT
jgi:hypothetical protein